MDSSELKLLQTKAYKFNTAHRVSKRVKINHELLITRHGIIEISQ